jgi:hypothetical protein
MSYSRIKKEKEDLRVIFQLWMGFQIPTGPLCSAEEHVLSL